MSVPCKVCGKPIRLAEGWWVHDQPYDPFAPPIHAPRPRERNRPAADGTFAEARNETGE